MNLRGAAVQGGLLAVVMALWSWVWCRHITRVRRAIAALWKVVGPESFFEANCRAADRAGVEARGSHVEVTAETVVDELDEGI